MAIQASQDVPDWLETAASEAVGSGIHAGGSGFGGQDMREVGVSCFCPQTRL